MKTIRFQDFMSGEYKMQDKKRRKQRVAKVTQLASAAVLPLATCGAVGTLGFAMKAFAATSSVPVMMGRLSHP
jgi:hypothetical protein